MLLMGGEAPPTPCPNQYQKKVLQNAVYKKFIKKQRPQGIPAALYTINSSNLG
jgi:hypothetical protein